MSFRRILIALDDSAIAAHAVEIGTELTTALKAQAALVYVVDPTLASQPDSGGAPEHPGSSSRHCGDRASWTGRPRNAILFEAWTLLADSSCSWHLAPCFAPTIARNVTW